jgi:fructose-1,6-bisphosphatase/inositol monophosphatase family enzyme
MSDSPPEATLNLTACLQLAKKLALEAGEMQTNATQLTMNIQSKGGIDLVTAIDKGCEKHIFENLRATFPTHKFIGEESASDVVLGDEPTWCVDPVDGTTNFVHSFPMFCVSIGLCVNKAPVMGVIYDPSRKEMYHAILGAGAFVNDVQIHVDHKATTLPQAFVCTNFGHSRDSAVLARQMRCTNALLHGQVRAIRMTGSCCLAMCHVARGWASCYFEYDIGGLWDVCAGIVIVQEAGGVVVHPDDGTSIVPCKSGKQKLSCGNATIVECVRQQQQQLTKTETHVNSGGSGGSGGSIGSIGSDGSSSISSNSSNIINNKKRKH